MSPSPREQSQPSHLDTTGPSRGLPPSVLKMNGLYRAGVCHRVRGRETLYGLRSRPITPAWKQKDERQFLLFRYSAADWPLGSTAGDMPSQRVTLGSCGR